MAKYLFIAEKPSLRKEIETVYRKHKSELSYTADFDNFAGHVCGLALPTAYKANGWDEKWEDINLPMIPDPFVIVVSNDKKKMFKDLTDKIKSGGYDYIVNACDPDREGNAIFELFRQKAGFKIPCKRFWTNDLTDKAILGALKSLRDNEEDYLKHLTEASLLRGRFDWLIGMNDTIAASLAMNTTAKIGRVKTPTLKLVVDRELAIKNFVPETTFELVSNYKEGFNGVLFDKDGNVRFKTKEDSKSIISKLGNTAKVISIEKKQAKTNAPKLYKLSDIQIEAGKALGFNADKTLEICQSLYQNHKVQSYPRTDCQYISAELCKDFPTLLKVVACYPNLKPYVDKLTSADYEKVKKSSSYVNDKELQKSGHSALVPTGVKPDFSKMTKDEKDLFEMVCKRFLAIFLDPLVEDKTTVITENNGYTFKTNGKVVVKKGYTEIYDKKLEDNELPELKKGQVVNVNKFDLSEKTTTPPAFFTDATLIEAMEKCGKYLDDEALKEIMKEKSGIGTPATRANIINELVKNGYITRTKKGKSESIHATELGISIIQNLEGKDITKVDLTGEFEEKLKKVEYGEITAKDFEKDMIAYVRKSVLDLKAVSKISYSKSGGSGEVLCKCPLCNSDVVETTKAYSCSNKECKFVFWKDNHYFNSIGKKVTKVLAKTLIEKRKVLLKGLKSKKGFSYDAIIVAEFKADGTTNFTMERPDKSEGRVVIGKCPICGKEVIEKAMMYGCEDDTCGFKIWKEDKYFQAFGKKMTKKIAQELLSKGQVWQEDLVSKAGKKFNAYIIIEPNTPNNNYKLEFK